MHVESFSSLYEFHRVAVALLSDHEAEHGLLLGVSRSAQAGGAPPDAYAVAIIVDEEPVAVALRTTSKLLLSRDAHEGAARMLAAHALARIPAPHGVLGPPGAVAAYAAEAEREGLTAKTLEASDPGDWAYASPGTTKSKASETRRRQMAMSAQVEERSTVRLNLAHAR